MNTLKYFLKSINIGSTKSTRLFSLLIISTIIIHVSAWAANYKFGTFLEVSRTAPRFYNMLYHGKDGGYFEHFQYILLIWCSILSSLWIVNRKYFDALSIPIIYFYLFLDDSLKLHDVYISSFLLNLLDKIPLFDQNIVRSKDIAEWINWLFVFVVILLISSPGLKSRSFEVRKFMKNNFIFFFVLTFFGVFLDLIEANINSWLPIYFRSGILKEFLILIEEIGEIGTISLMCIWLFQINDNGKRDLSLFGSSRED